jgi:hypothetical protein
MMNRASAPEYDRFKTIVAVILVAILILMLLRGCAMNVVPQSPAEAIASPNATVVPPTVQPPSQTLSETSPTETVAPSPSPAAQATRTPTTVPAAEAITTPVATEVTATLVAEATPTQAQTAACNTSVPSRLSVGQTARVLQRLNMRTEPAINASLIQTNPTDTQVEIIGGPVCTPVGDRAYQWWQIRLADGKEGWSAESQLNSPSYFLEPNS